MSENKNDGKSPISKSTYIVSVLVCLLPVIAGILLYPSLPEELVTHWAADGTPNGWQSKFVGAIVFPGILCLVQLAMPRLIKADPKNRNLDKKIANVICWIIPVCSLLCSASTLCAGLGIPLKVEILIPVFVGLLFLIVGNYMPKMHQSYTVGIKLPRTLDSEENWEKTHRLAGFVWTVGGLLIILGAFCPYRAGIILVVIALCILIPVIFSWLYYKKEEGK